jgi:lipopolysaccharide/colanic/teichoic acid biosynthesis glycosyltransferase
LSDGQPGIQLRQKTILGKNGLTGLVQINFYKNLTSDEIEFYNYYYAKTKAWPRC